MASRSYLLEPSPHGPRIGTNGLHEAPAAIGVGRIPVDFDFEQSTPALSCGAVPSSPIRPELTQSDEGMEIIEGVFAKHGVDTQPDI